jgi:hypothetical protein
MATPTPPKFKKGDFVLHNGVRRKVIAKCKHPGPEAYLVEGLVGTIPVHKLSPAPEAPKPAQPSPQTQQTAQ